MLGSVGLTEQPSWAAGVCVGGQQHLLVVTEGPSEEGMAHFHRSVFPICFQDKVFLCNPGLPQTHGFSHRLSHPTVVLLCGRNVRVRALAEI